MQEQTINQPANLTKGQAAEENSITQQVRHPVVLQPSGRCFDALADQTLLQAALAGGARVPYGCQSGVCGACRATVVEGEVDGGQGAGLFPSDAARGDRLLCTARACGPVTLKMNELPITLPAPRSFPVRVQSMERVAEDVMILTLKLPSHDPVDFLAGQYVDIVLNDGERRSFSIANPPGQGVIELHVRHVPGGRFTSEVFSTMKTKDILRLHGPLGDFYLRDSARPLLFVAGGTGWAPVQGVISHMLTKEMPRPVAVYWGARDRAGLYRKELIEAWQASHSLLRYVPVLSVPEPEWSGRRGFVHQAALEDIPDLSGYDVYVCGTPPMVEAARRDFVERGGLPEDRFFADVFRFSSHA